MRKVDILKSGKLSSPIGPSGTLRRLMQHRDYLLKGGYSLSIFNSDGLVASVEESFCENTTERRGKLLVYRKRVKDTIKTSIPKNWVLTQLYICFLLLKARKLVKAYLRLNRSADILVFHDFFVCLFYHRLREGDSKTILFSHSDGIPFNMLYVTYPKLKNTILANWLESRHRDVIQMVDRMVFIAEIGKKNFLNYYKEFPSEKATFFHNGIDDLSFPRRKANRYLKYKLICVGTLSERKGQRIIIHALSKLNRSVLESIHLTLIGDGPDRSYIERFINDNNLGMNVELIGSVKNDFINDYLNDSDIYVLMSKNEGLPISIIEAMRASLPIISTNVSGIPELVTTDYNGLLLDPDESQLCLVLSSLDKHNWNVLGSNSRDKFVKQFLFDTMLEKYKKMLEDLG
jgi:glycosyltransferase involved in cell wall biosynthesis